MAFLHGDAGLLADTIDLVCIFEALHDMSQPVEVLHAARRALAPGGAVLIVDERVAATFTAPDQDVSSHFPRKCL